MSDFVVYVCPVCGDTRRCTPREGTTEFMCDFVHKPTAMVRCWPLPEVAEKNSEEEQKRNQVLSQFKGYAKALAYQDGIELAFIMETIRDYLKREKE